MLPPPPDGFPTPESVGSPPLLGEKAPPEFAHKNLAAEPSSASVPSCHPPTCQGRREAGLRPMAMFAPPKTWMPSREPVRLVAWPGIQTKTCLTQRKGCESVPTPSDASDRPPAAKTTKNGSIYRQNPRSRPRLWHGGIPSVKIMGMSVRSRQLSPTQPLQTESG